jgi:hypothetical protein
MRQRRLDLLLEEFDRAFRAHQSSHHASSVNDI